MAEEPEAARARVGFLPETPPLYPEMTVEAFLRFVARINGVQGGDVEGAVDRAVRAAAIADRRRDRIGTLSHGYQRRVGIAHVIVHKPALILLDEPTSGLDPVQILQMRGLIRSLREEHTVMVSSHILSEMHQMCDRILVLNEGRIVAEGSEEELAGHVSGATTVDLEVRASRDALAGALKSIAAVTRHEIKREAGGVLEATIEMASDGREELAQALVQGGLGLRRIDRSNLGLESIFLQLTGDRAPEVTHG
jgi:ABC-2 type transport system ATP-binding protein